MGKKKWIDKKTAVTFTLVHRPQNDPLIYDESAPSMVFKQVDSGKAQPRTLDNLSPIGATPSSTTTTTSSSSTSKLKTTNDLAAELGANVTSTVRDNEGEAAQYGVYYDDSKYDYMQHLRPIGASSEAVFIEAKTSADKGKHKVSLEDALRSGAGTGNSILPADILPSTNLLKTTYQNQQNLPDALAGFQPDMDPGLREVLEALEDEAYVDNDEDLFGELTMGGEMTEGEQEEFIDGDYEVEHGGYGYGYGHAYGQEDEDDDGWATDDTERPLPSTKSKNTATVTFVPPNAPVPAKSGSLSTPDDGKSNNDNETDNSAWLAEYSKFQNARQASKKKSAAAAAAAAAANGDLASSILSFGASSEFSLGGSRKRRQRRRGARTESTGYSMTSSSLARTEGLTLLDDRFDKIEEAYADSDEDEDKYDRLPPSQGPEGFVETRQDFESIMDDFLNNYSVGGRSRRVKRGKQQTGMEQLDEIRRELGRARIR